MAMPDARATIDRAMSEAEVQAAVTDALDANGWYWHHAYDSRRSKPGVPDLLCIRGPVLWWLECKTEKGRVRPEQEAFLERIRHPDGTSKIKFVAADIVRPSDLGTVLPLIASARR